nr:MAG TPA: hypothetical protein [Caudoviricetes sp.]
MDHLAFIFPVGSEDRENKKSSDWRKPYERQETNDRHRRGTDRHFACDQRRVQTAGEKSIHPR